MYGNTRDYYADYSCLICRLYSQSFIKNSPAPCRTGCGCSGGLSVFYGEFALFVVIEMEKRSSCRVLWEKYKRSCPLDKSVYIFSNYPDVFQSNCGNKPD